tara:strand:+ start:1047 stop:1928 length:882 start_codon:yes stop_codon:yes gene_type:complete
MFLSATPHPRTRELSGDGGGHWYYPDGRPLHTVQSKDGSERNTTKRDARKLGLYPSVTTVTKVIGNPSLDRWKQQQMLNACVAMPIRQGEDLAEYEAKVKGMAQKKMVDARAFGSLMHNAIDELNKSFFLGSEYAEIADYVKHYAQWLKESKVEILDSEFVAVSDRYGYAGQVDAIAKVDGKMTLLDYKTQDVKTDSKGNLKPNYYDSWLWQLAAYKNAEWAGKPKRITQVMSVVLCSHTPAPPMIKVWSKDELDAGWKTFRAACEIWQLTNKFNPSLNVEQLKSNTNGQVAA